MADQANEQIKYAVDLLKAGSLVAFPTETVYGLAADATNDRSIASLYRLKGRPLFNPLIVHVGSVEAACRLGDFSAKAQKLAQIFWPGPLTLIVPRRKNCSISLLALAGLESVALRIPAHPIALALLKDYDGPLVAPSANRSGHISPTLASHVKGSFGSDIALILDGGPASIGLESTIVNMLDDHRPAILRAGGLVTERIEEALGTKLPFARALSSLSELPLAPGQLMSHYAPRASVRLHCLRPEENEAYLGFKDLNFGPFNLSASGDLCEAAANFFRLLHEIDATGTASIAVAPIPNHGLGVAINDRLSRAAAPRPGLFIGGKI